MSSVTHRGEYFEDNLKEKKYSELKKTILVSRLKEKLIFAQNVHPCNWIGADSS